MCNAEWLGSAENVENAQYYSRIMTYQATVGWYFLLQIQNCSADIPEGTKHFIT